MAEKLTFRTAFARWDDSRLVIGNQFLQRTIDLQNHYPVTVSLVSGGTEFSAPQKNSCDCSFFGLNMPGRNETDWHISSPVSAVIVENPPFDMSEIRVACLADKKRSGNSITLIMAHGVGDCRPLKINIDELKEFLV